MGKEMERRLEAGDGKREGQAFEQREDRIGDMLREENTTFLML